VVYLIADAGFGLTIWPATLIAFVFGFSFRLLSRRLQWEEPLPRNQEGAAVLSS
jgi:uncharacterized membrane protein YeiH